MIEGIQVLRDIVIILSAVTITVMVVIVGRALLGLTQTAEDVRLFVVNAATGVINPIKGVKGVLLAIGRIRPWH